MFYIDGLDGDGVSTRLFEFPTLSEARRVMSRYTSREDAGGWDFIEITDEVGAVRDTWNREDEEDELEYWDREDHEIFANPGSALRAESATNPRDCNCPNCGAENVLTREDRALGYQCDSCADQIEHGGY